MDLESGSGDLLDALACPYDGLPLHSGERRRLECAGGHSFPVVDGIPVLLRSDVDETIHMLSSSLKAGCDYAEGKATDPWFIDTLGISDVEKAGVRAAIERGNIKVDPVISYLLAHTSGFLYKDLVGTVSEYPIPALPLPPGDGRRLLDIGCSWGRWSMAAARRGYRAVGIDPSLGAVLAARRLANALDLGFDGVVGDARFLPFRAESFGAVHSFSVLQHFSREDATRSLREARRVLAPGGRVLVQMAAAFGIRSLQHQLIRGFREPEGFEVRYWTPSQLARTFREIFGECELSAAGYFGLGLLADDERFMAPGRRLLIRMSERLKRLSRAIKPLVMVADSLYLRSGR